jgi:carboxylesterase type B
MLVQSISAIFVSLFCFNAALATPRDNTIKHLIDLGYARHVPTWINTTSSGTKLLNYNNIRYAEPPTGWKRFRKPVTPPPYQCDIQDGNRSSWETDCISSATLGVPFPLLDGQTWGSEDCLFLNVIVPEGAKEGDRLPVLHWIVGSAFAFGGKDWTGFGINTYGLYSRPLNLTDQFIIVTHNYRYVYGLRHACWTDQTSLGISGWLPKLSEDMNGNVGVWDTLAAIEWTKKYISKFGGDPDRITAIGQSAGAASLTWLLLAEGGTMTLPFDQVIISSPALAPRRNIERSRPVFDRILNATGCSTVECMRNITETDLRKGNEYIYSLFPDGGGGTLGPGVGLGPLVDGEMVSELPAIAFAKGDFNKQLKSIIVGNTASEVSAHVLSPLQWLTSL